MSSYKPKIKVEPTGLKRTLELVSIAGVIYIVLLLIQNWGSLPDKVPSHFGFNGSPDAYAGKSSLLGLAAIAIFIFLMLTIADRFPHLYNYFWKITAENAYRQYQLARTLLAAVKTEMIWIFGYILMMQMKVSRGEVEGLNPLFLVFFMVTIFGTVGIYLFVSYKMR